jgi:hypothetical protein
MNPIQETAIHAQHAVGSKLVDGIHAAAKLFSELRRLGVDDALGWAGLERRHSPLRGYVTFGAGLAVGAGIGILFAPMSGKDTRKAIADAFKKGEKKAEAKAEAVAAEAGAGFHEVTTFS